MKLEKLNKEFETKKKALESLSRNVNFHVAGVYEKITKDYKSVLNHKESVKEDLEIFEFSTGHVESAKIKTLEETFLEVNKTFNSIFSMLLPGASARLEKLEDDNIEEGIEFRIAFNGLWKPNLSGLSGGQRSLLALSYILALLKCNPAPIYILDEVDAALDLSHTQHIGEVILEHFPQSQFLIISLKEGMWGHANVLIQVNYKEGKSEIQRISGTTASIMPRKFNDFENELDQYVDEDNYKPKNKKRNK